MYYKEFISNNLGIVKEEDQVKLKETKISIFGMNGIGDLSCLLLARLGIENFFLFDPNRVEIAEINRERVATTKTVGTQKSDALEEMLREINPAITVKTEKSKNDFDVLLKDADIIINDLHDIESCQLVFEKAREIKKTVIEGIPIPYGNVQVFTYNSMEWRQTHDISEDVLNKLIAKRTTKMELYLSSLDKLEGFLNFYQEDKLKSFILNPLEPNIPSLGTWNALTASLVTTEVLKIVLDWGMTIKSPRMMVYDPYSFRLMLYDLQTKDTRRL